MSVSDIGSRNTSQAGEIDHLIDTGKIGHDRGLPVSIQIRVERQLFWHLHFSIVGFHDFWSAHKSFILENLLIATCVAYPQHFYGKNYFPNEI